MMTYTISRAEQVLQTQRQALNLRWYPHYHLAARAGWINDPNGLVWFHLGNLRYLSTSPVLHPVGTDALGARAQ